MLYIKSHKNKKSIFDRFLEKIKNYNFTSDIFKQLGQIEKKIVNKKKKKNIKNNYTNIFFLSIFIDQFGKIKSRSDTNLKIRSQKCISHLIRKARYYGLIPYLKENVII